MPKRKSKKENDFQKVKFKVGKKLPKAENLTSTAFRTKSIVVKEQLKESSSDDLRQKVLNKSKNPQELLAHLQHFSPSFRLNSLNTIKAIIISDPIKLLLYIGSIIDKVSSLSSDVERDIRNAALECLKSVFGAVPADDCSAFMPILVARLQCAMTHLNEDIKLDSIKLVQLLITCYPQALQKYSFKVAFNFLDLISTTASNGKRSLKASPVSKLSTANWRYQAFSQLLSLLSINDFIASSGASKQPNPSTAGAVQMEQSNMSFTGDENVKSHRIDDAFYLSMVNMEKYSCFHQSILDEDSDEIVSQFTIQILPLIKESWIELYSNEQCYSISDEAVECLTVLCNILASLYHTLRKTKAKGSQQVIESLKNEVTFMVKNGFPIGHSDNLQTGKAIYGKKKNRPSEELNSCLLLSIKLSVLAENLNCGASSTTKFLSSILTRINLGIIDSDLYNILESIEPSESIQTCIRILNEAQNLPEHRMETILDLSEKYITDSSAERLLVEKLKDSIVVCITSSRLPVCLIIRTLHLLNKALLFHKSTLDAQSYTNILAVCQSSSQSCPSSSTETKENKYDIFNPAFILLQHVQPITTDVLNALKTILCCHSVTSRSLVNLLLHILHKRCLDDVENHKPKAQYLRFLCSLLIGESQTDTPDKNLNHMREVVIPGVCEHITTAFHNTEQVIEIMDYFYSKVLCDSVLSLASCWSLLYTLSTSVQLPVELMSRILLQYVEQLSNADDRKICGEQNYALLNGVIQSRTDVLEAFFTKLAQQVKDCIKGDDFNRCLKCLSVAMDAKWQYLVSKNVLYRLQQRLKENSLLEKAQMCSHFQCFNQLDVFVI